MGRASFTDGNSDLRHAAHIIDGGLVLFSHALRQLAVLGGCFLNPSYYLAASDHGDLSSRDGLQGSNGHSPRAGAVVRTNLSHRFVPPIATTVMVTVRRLSTGLVAVAGLELRPASGKYGGL